MEFTGDFPGNALPFTATVYMRGARGKRLRVFRLCGQDLGGRDSQHIDNLLAGHPLGIEQGIQREAIDHRAKFRDQAVALSRSGSRSETADFVHRASLAYIGIDFVQPLPLAMMADHVHLEFQVKKHALPVAQITREMLRENLDPFIHAGGRGKAGDHLFLAAHHVFFEDGKKHIFLIREIGVERAPGLACPGGDILDPRRLESLRREDRTSRGHQIFAGREGPLLLVL